MFCLFIEIYWNIVEAMIKYFLCPFAAYYLRYAVRSFFTMSRISLADGKRAGQKVQRKIAVAVQNVKPLYFLSRSFALSHKNLLSYSICFNNQIGQGAKTEGLEREDYRGRDRRGKA
jgi:hypothetical protein